MKKIDLKTGLALTWFVPVLLALALLVPLLWGSAELRGPVLVPLLVALAALFLAGLGLGIRLASGASLRAIYGLVESDSGSASTYRRPTTDA